MHKKLLFLVVTIVIAFVVIVTKKYFNNQNSNILQTTSEIRAYIQDIDSTKNALTDLGATFKSEYVFTDYIYEPKGVYWDLNQQFIRLRVYDKTNWDQKKCVLVHKMKKTQGITGKILIHQEFDEITQAQEVLKDDYSFLFSFYRIGWQYSLNGNQIFVENIENLNPTIEIVAFDKNKIDDIFAKLLIKNVIEYSVPYLIQEKFKKSI